jgi:molybdopterin converting factor small subunit
MSIAVHFVASLQSYTGNREVILTSGRSIGECLRQATGEFPGIKPKLFSRNGNLQNRIGIYINGKNASPHELTRPTKDGDQIYIIEIFSGG